MTDLEQALGDKEVSVAAYAASSIGFIATPAYLPTLETFIAAENTPAIKRDLVEASYRLGGKESLQQLLDFLNTSDEDSAPGILNRIQFLVQQRPPVSLNRDAPRLSEALNALALRFPIWQVYVEEILEDLTKLAQGEPS